MTKTYSVIITNSPFEPNLQKAGDLIIKLHVPYSKDQVTVKINPNIIKHDDAPQPNTKQVYIYSDNAETLTLNFNFKSNKIQKIKVGTKDYEIKLMKISFSKSHGQEFPTFEFQVIEL